MIFSKTPKTKGFTLIETLVSILIFSVSIVALISITAGGVSDTGFVKKKQNAYFLAQEGVELVRFMRDTAIRGGGDWFVFAAELSNLCSSSDGCNIDSYLLAGGNPISSVVDSCSGSCSVMKHDSLSGYQYTYGDKTDIVRTIKFQKVSGGHSEEMEVYSEVEYSHGNRDYSVVLREVITNWVNPAP